MSVETRPRPFAAGRPSAVAAKLHARRSRWWRIAPLGAILATYLILAGYYAAHNPPFEAPEEGQHFTVAREVAAGRLPVLTYRPTSIGEEQQPRLYYLILAPFVGWGDGSIAPWLPAPPFAPPKGALLALYAARYVTILLGILAILGTYCCALALFADPRLAAAAALFQVLIPGFLMSSSSVNNDNATNAFAALSLLFCVRALCARETPWLAMAAFTVFAALTALSKLTGLFVLPVFALSLLALAARSRQGRLRLLIGASVAALLLAVGLAAADPTSRLGVALRLVIGGESAYSPSNLLWAFGHLTPDTLRDFGGLLAKTSLGIPGWQALKEIDAKLNAAAAVFLILAMIGWIKYVVARDGWRGLPRRRRLALIIMAVALGLVLSELLVVQVGKPYTAYHWGVTHARYLFPVIGVASLLLIGGALQVFPATWRPTVGAVFLSTCAALVLTTPFYKTDDPSTPLFNEQASGHAAANALPGATTVAATAEGLTLVGYQLPDRSLRPGDSVQLDLLWRAEANLSLDFRAYVHLVDWRGQLVAQDESSPTGYRFPTRLWRSGDVVRDSRRLVIPASAAPGAYSIETGLYYFPEQGKPVSLSYAVPDGSKPVSKLKLGSIKIRQPVFDPATLSTPMDIHYGDQIALVGYNPSPVSLSPGERLAVSLYWRALRRPSNDYVVSVQILDQGGRLVAQDDAQPSKGAYPTSIWEAGETVVDTHEISLPSSLPPGVYRLGVVVYLPSETKRLPVFDASGAPKGDISFLEPVTVP